jgi:hypothetical protein
MIPISSAPVRKNPRPKADSRRGVQARLRDVERPDEIIERAGRQSSIDPAVSSGQLRVVIAGGDGARLPTVNELQGARYQGRKIAETANKLHG